MSQKSRGAGRHDRGKHTSRWPLYIVSIALLIGAAVAIAWLATGSVRADAAATHQTKAQDAIQHDDFDTAYREATYAEALASTDQRKLDRGAIAYLRRDYASAADAFRSVPKASPLYESARAGLVVAAAADGNRTTYEKTEGEFASESGKVLKYQAALLIGDVKTLAEACLCDSESVAQHYLVAIGQGVTDPTAALRTLDDQADDEAFVSSDDAYPRFAFQASHVTTEQVATLRSALERAVVAHAPATRKLLIAQAVTPSSYLRYAKSEAESALDDDPKYRDGWNTLAGVQIGLREYGSAERSLQTSLDLDPAFGETWHLKAELAKAKGDPGKEREFADKAKQLGYKK